MVEEPPAEVEAETVEEEVAATSEAEEPANEEQTPEAPPAERDADDLWGDTVSYIQMSSSSMAEQIVSFV